MAVQSHRAGRAGSPGAGRRAGRCSNRMARARDRGPKLITTVISTTRAAGRDVMMRRILGRWPAARAWLSRSICARTRSVVQETSCLGEREPASTSTITWANCLGHAAAAAPSTGWWSALKAGDGPAGTSPRPGARSACGLGPAGSRAAPAGSRADGHAGPCVSQSKGGQPAGTAMSRGAGKTGKASWPWPAGRSGVRVDGMFRFQSGECERPRTPRGGAFACLVTDL